MWNLLKWPYLFKTGNWSTKEESLNTIKEGKNVSWFFPLPLSEEQKTQQQKQQGFVVVII
jgi:hypothetical protein